MVGACVSRRCSLGLVVGLSLVGCMRDDPVPVVQLVPPGTAGVGGLMGGSGGAAVGGASSGGGLAGRGGSPSVAPVIEHPFAIELDYRMDRAGFFLEPNRRSALEAAAKLLGYRRAHRAGARESRVLVERLFRMPVFTLATGVWVGLSRIPGQSPPRDGSRHTAEG
jgi:hypothetical protein